MKSSILKICFSVLLCFIIVNAGLSRNYQTASDNFQLQMEFEESIVLKDARLLGNDGSEISVNLIRQAFLGKVNLYGVFTLNVTYQQKYEKQEKSFSMPILLQPGKTVLRFEKIPYKYEISGTSKESCSAYLVLLAMDQKALQSIRQSKSRLDAATKEGSKNLISDAENDLTKKENTRKHLFLDFIKKNPNSIVSLFAMNMYAMIEIENPIEVEKAIHLLDDSLQKAGEVIELSQKVESYKKIMVGQPAPLITQADTSGKIISLEDLKGKYVLIDFWASWCKPCRAKNPFLLRLYNEYKDKDFTILGVSLDSYKEPWIKAINEDHLSWLQISDLRGWKNEAAEVYNIFSVPQNYLLDKNGIIIAKNLSDKSLLEKLNKILTSNP